MNYQKIYNSLIERGKTRGLNKKKLDYYTEQHHILPKCMNGDNNKDNLVLLTAEEHFVAHQLLVKIYPNNENLIFACQLMTIAIPEIREYRSKNKFYSWIKNKSAFFTSRRLKGRTVRNDPWRKKVFEQLTGRTKETHQYIQDISDKLTGRTKETCPGVAIRTEQLTGRTKETHQYIQDISDKLTGRTKETCPGVAIRTEKNNILPVEIRLLLVKKRDEGMTLSEIYEWLSKELNYKLAYSSVGKIYHRTKKEIVKNSYMHQ